jgi:hypothetical protein
MIMCHHGEHHHGHQHGQECHCQEKHTESRCGCGEESCGSSGHFQRRYQTKAEQVADLETFLGTLKQEILAVEEHLAALRQ